MAVAIALDLRRPAGIAPTVRLDVHVGAPATRSPVAASHPRRRRRRRRMEAVIEANAPSRSSPPLASMAPIWSNARLDLSRLEADGDGRGRSLFEPIGVGWQSWASVVPDGAAAASSVRIALARVAVDRLRLVAAWALAGAHSSQPDRPARASASAS